MEKNKVFLIIIIVLLVVLLSAIGVLGFQLAKVLQNGTGGNSGGTSNTFAGAMLTPEQVHIVNLDKAINTNLATGDDGTSHIISVTLSVGANNTDKKESPKVIETLEKSKDIVRDICVNTVRSKTYEQLKRQDGESNLRQ